MASIASGSGGRQPPSSGQGVGKDTGHRAPVMASISPSGDGETPQTAAWSTALSSAANIDKTYIVNGLGLIPRYRRTTLAEARMAAQVYEVLDGDTYEVVDRLPAGPMANRTMPAATATAQQMAGIAVQETAIATGSGPASDQYNATQVHHGDAFQNSDSDNAGNSSEEPCDRSTSSSGATSAS